MDFHLYYTGDAFKVCSTEDADKANKLKRGGIYKCKLSLVRNYAFHRKYFKMLSVAWELIGEQKQAVFGHNFDGFRKTVEVAAGHCDKVYNLSLKSWVEIPKTVSFSGEDEHGFEQLYERVRDVLLTVFLADVSKNDFERILLNF